MEDLKQGFRYLITQGVWDKYIDEIFIIEVAEMAYHIQWNQAGKSWISKRRFLEKYKIYETLGDTIANFTPVTSS